MGLQPVLLLVPPAALLRATELAVPPVVEVLLWAIPGLLALRAALAARSSGPRGAARAWWLVVAVCLLICADKAVDLNAVLMDQVRELAREYAPELRAHGASQGLRVALLGAGALVAGGVLWFLVGGRAGIDRPRLLAFFGLLLIVAFLAARLTGPGRMLEENDWIAWPVQLVALASICRGALLAAGRARTHDGHKEERA